MFLHMNLKCCNLPCLVPSDLVYFYKQELGAFFESLGKNPEESSFGHEIVSGNSKHEVNTTS